MSLHKFALRFIATVAVFAAGHVAWGQGTYHPFAEPISMGTDWQYFAPLDVNTLTEIAPRKRPNTGWFGTYDRTYLWVSRPQTEQSADTGDFGWGNLYSIGFMTEEDKGWFASFRSIGGPNVYDRVLQERVNRLNEDDVFDPNDPVMPPTDRNDPQLGFRAYVLGDSLNVFGMTNFELNRTWRREPLRYGGIFEPMIGFRYNTINDTALNETYFRDGVLISEPGTIDTEARVEHYITHTTTTKNQMVGGQLGFRYYGHLERWTLATEFRAFGMQNFQTNRYSLRTINTEYDGVDLGAEVVTEAETNNFIYQNNSEFVFGFESRSEMAYRVTQAFNLRFGVEVMHYAQGIWRGANPGFGPTGVQDQDVTLAGFYFGANINR
ncbi:MAG: hypothetical protein KatS3mg111_3035 [Pirellulaceae bacterium]|nr:MAG: hypothetical protein KatS3mg111_3035 [Pirellulaceae bacterium]